MTEAEAQLRKGLDVLAGLPDGLWRQQQELDLQVALGHALFATHGHSTVEVSEATVRARALAEQLDRPEYLVPLIGDQYLVHIDGKTQGMGYCARRDKDGDTQSISWHQAPGADKDECKYLRHG